MRPPPSRAENGDHIPPVPHPDTAHWLQRILALIPNNPSHPAQVAIRTYCLSLCLSLGPSLIPFVTPGGSKWHTRNDLKRVLARDLGIGGFAFSFTLAIGGGSLIRELWRALDEITPMGTGEEESPANAAALKIRAWISALPVKLSSAQKTFFSNVAAGSAGLLLLEKGRRPSNRPHSAPPSASRTLDLTLLLLVRAVDAAVQSFVAKQSVVVREGDSLPTQITKTERQRHISLRRQALRTQIDSLVFWACSARIMWCFFYEPQRLPKSYVKWINTLANLDSRLLTALRVIRTGEWSYIKGSPLHSNLLREYARDLGHPAAWGDPAALPAYGGPRADRVWKQLGLTTRPGVGGLPCQIVHGTVGTSLGLEDSCTANSGLRGVKVLLEAMAIYLPVHFFPQILSRPRTLLDPRRVLDTLLGALRSATFLTAFVTSYWYSVCLTRTLVFARLFPSISHDFWDGPYGCVLAGCLVCGSSIWIENGRRRGEMALYVLPRAVRACLPDRWVRSGNVGVRMAERLTFILSLASLLTAATHHPQALRGLSKFALRYVTNGPNVAFWKPPPPPDLEARGTSKAIAEA